MLLRAIHVQRRLQVKFKMTYDPIRVTKASAACKLTLLYVLHLLYCIDHQASRTAQASSSRPECACQPVQEALPVDQSADDPEQSVLMMLDAEVRGRAQTRGDLLENCCQWEGLIRMSEPGERSVYAVQLAG